MELVDHAVRVAVLAECLRRAALSDRDARQLVGRAVDAQRRDARGVDAVEAAVRRVMGRLRLAKQRDDQVEVIDPTPIDRIK